MLSQICQNEFRGKGIFINSKWTVKQNGNSISPVQSLFHSYCSATVAQDTDASLVFSTVETVRLTIVVKKRSSTSIWVRAAPKSWSKYTIPKFDHSISYID